MADLDWIFDGDDQSSETNETITSRMKRAELKRERVTALKKENAGQIVTELPKQGESFHIISNGSFDYFTFVPIVIELLGNYSVHFYGSTWTMSRGNVTDLFELFDASKIGSLNILTGIYFKRRESSVYATLYNGIELRKQRYRALENHAKIMLFNHHDNYIVIEGSANFTANPRIEQTTIINDKSLWEFHRQWMDEIFNG
jgi:hypothetical protein